MVVLLFLCARKDRVGTHDVIVRPTRCQWRQEALPWFLTTCLDWPSRMFMPYGSHSPIWAGPILGFRPIVNVFEIRIWVVASGTYIRNNVVSSGLQGEITEQ